MHLQFRGNEGQLDADEADMEPLVEPQFSRVPAFRPEPDEASVRAALQILQNAARPVIVAGGGVRASGAAAELVALAEALQIPVATSLNGKDSIPGTHPLAVGVVGSYSRESANRVVNSADLVCFIGSETGGMTTHFWAVPKIGTPAIQIDIDPEALGRNYPLAAGVNGDAKVTLQKMLAACDRTTAAKRKAWIGEAQKISGEWRDKYKDALTSDAVPIRPERLCHELSKHVPDDAIVVVDTGHAGMWMGGMFDLTSPRQSYMRSAGHLGWAFPAGLGAKCAVPERPVVTFTGDAGFWYHIAEIETAARWNINAVTVVNNNGGGNQSKRGFDRVYGGKQTDKARELWTFRQTNFARIAEDMGALGIRVEAGFGISGGLGASARRQSPGRHRRGHRYRRTGAGCRQLGVADFRGLRAGDAALLCLRAAPAERRTTSEICTSCAANGLVLRQIMPMVRDGCGFLKRATDTAAERVSTATAISGIKVTPMPALTICTSVDSELASSTSRGSADCVLQNDSACSRKQCPSSSSRSRISRKRSLLGAGVPSSLPGRTRRKFSANSATSVSDGSDTGSATMAVSSRPSASSWISFDVRASRT